MFKEKVFLRKLISERYLGKLIPLLVFLGLFLPWVRLPLTGGLSSFSIQSPVYLSWGLLLLPIAILNIIRIRWYLLFPLLLIVLSFPLKTHWDYEFIQDVISEDIQIGNIQMFAEDVYEPNILYLPTDTRISDMSNLWSDPFPRLTFTVGTLGVGFWIVFIGAIIVSRKLGRKKIIIAFLLALILTSPEILTASFLSVGRDAFFIGSYSKSLDRYRLAMDINQSFGNKTLNKLETYYLWVGGSLFHRGIEDVPEVYFYIGNNLEGIGSFVKSKEMYQKSMILPPAKKALARVLVKEAINDFVNGRYGSAMERLGEAFEIDDNQLEALFYMTYISSVLKDQDSAFYYSSLLFERCKENILLSDVFNIHGDLYHKSETFSNSRTMYRKSVEHFDRLKSGNYHAWKGIAGW